ncbi:adenine nucleotide alpha hydrolase family protein [Maridesulfovibrio frigidus]
MSSHGLGLEKRGGTSASIGSVTAKVIKNSPLPVQIVP